MNYKTTNFYTMNKVFSHLSTSIVESNDNVYLQRQKDTEISSESLKGN